MKKLISIFILLFFFGEKNYSQSYYFKHYQVENGLSNNTVLCSVQDNRGFMWFGTKDGINRFDGYNFKIFSSDAEDKNTIGENYVRGLYKDDSGYIYAGTSNGVYKYNEQLENFSTIVKTNNTVREMVKDVSGNFWFVDGTTLKRIDKNSNKIYTYENKDANINTICSAPDGTLWAATTNGILKKYNAATNSFFDFNMFSHSPNTPLRWIEKIYATNDGNILVGTTSHGIKIFDTKDLSYKDIIAYNADNTEIFVRDFLQSASSEYWAATESGIFIYNNNTGKIINLKKHYNNPYSISDNAIYTLCKDKEGGIWSGTYFGGLNYYPKQYYSFEKYFPDYSEHAISGNAVREICEDSNGKLWVGTEDGGLNIFDKKTASFTKFTPSGKRTDIAYFNIHGLLCNGKNLWIGTFEHGLDIMDINTGKVIKHYAAGPDEHQLKSNFIVSLYKTRLGTIYIGTGKGLFRFNNKEQNFTFINQLPDWLFVHSITEDHAGNLWITTFGNGCYRFNPQTNSVKNFNFDTTNKKSLGSSRATSVFEDDAHRIWICTESGGLCLLNKDDNTFTTYTTKNGFPSDSFFKILEDEKKNLWITTTKGLACFNPVTAYLKVYTKANGLLSDQFNYNSAFKDSAGKMYFGSVKGLICFNPDNFIANNFIPPVYITGLQVNNKELTTDEKNSPLKQPISFTNKIKIPHNKSSFSIDFAALSYTAPETTEYAYKMEGLDKSWTYIKTNRKVYFTNLAPANYIFKVKAATGNGTFTKDEQRLIIEILPPFWATTWAYIFYAIVIGVIAFWLMRIYHNRQVEKHKRKIELMEHEKEKELYQAKIEFFTNVAHEIRTPLTLIKAPMEKLMKNATDMQAANVYLKTMEKNTNRLVDLTNELLDFRKTETKGFSLDFKQINIAELLKDIYTNFETIAEQKNLDYKLLLSGMQVLAYADTEALNKILSNLLNNAIKYADKKVHLKLLPVTDNNFIIEIENDGYIIPEELKEKVFEPFFRIEKTKHQMGSGIGLALSRSLAELHKGKLYMKKAETRMNVFILSLPVNNENENAL
ncbi:MAG: two-component regulator propeller domain-containing protein [Parafilimonas sp.]